MVKIKVVDKWIDEHRIGVQLQFDFGIGRPITKIFEYSLDDFSFSKLRNDVKLFVNKIQSKIEEYSKIPSEITL